MPDPFDSKLVNARDQIFLRIIFDINVLHNIETKCTLTPSFLTLLSQGSVMPQPPSAWRWTRKVSGKTVSRGLSAEQADLMKQAITNQRKMDAIIDEMRNLSQKIILALPRKSMIRTTANRPKLPLS